MEEKKRVLIVDDDPGIQDAFRMIFEQAGYQAAIYADGNELIIGNYHLPDLFILDKQLSGVDGLDICRHLKSLEKSKDVPVIILSASPMLYKLAIAAGANDFQEKPFRMHDLLDKVHKLLY